jgi:hypothetical protein
MAAASLNFHGSGCVSLGGYAAAIPSKVGEPRFGLGVKDPPLATPFEAHLTGVQSVVGQDQPLALLGCQTVFHQRQI